MRMVTGQAPVVGGNAAGARERALDDAIRQAVDQALAELVDPSDPRRPRQGDEGAAGEGPQLRPPLPDARGG